MNAFETALGVLFAIILVAVAVFFAYRQQLILRTLTFNVELPADHRRYLLQQCQRRIFGSLLLLVLAAMLIGCMFLDFDPLRRPLEELPPAEQEAVKQSVRFLSIYVMSMLLVLMVMLVIAVFDFWATARFGMQQQKRLLQEHHEILAAELEELRHREAESN